MSGVRLPAIEVPGPETGNLLPLLHEIRHALERLITEGEETIIDLRALPFAPGEARRLDKLLGDGEVTAVLDALGESRIRETAHSGVWRVTHLNPAGEVLGSYIEITRVPALLRSQEAEMRAALARLDRQLQPFQPGELP